MNKYLPTSIILLLFVFVLGCLNLPIKTTNPKSLALKEDDQVFVVYKYPNLAWKDDRDILGLTDVNVCDCLPNGGKIVLYNVGPNGLLIEGVGTDKPKPTHGIGDSYNLNYPLASGNEFDAKVSNMVTIQASQNSSINKIAILDTGVDPNFVEKSNLETSLLCDTYKNYNDDHRDSSGNGGYHGTIVTQLLLSQYDVSERPKIIPIKILDKNKQGTVFDMICGLYAAKNAKADAINASLGYYGPPILALEDAIKAVNVPVFVGAGNKIDQTGGRYLDVINPKFYPACYNNIQNLFTVSSCFNNSSQGSNFINCSNQNFSTTYVDAYVETNNTTDYNYFNFRSQIISGSSYATPIFAGKYMQNINNSNSLLTQTTLGKVMVKGVYNSNMNP